MAIALLGGVTVEDGQSRLNPRDRVVLAALALRNGENVRAEQLADALWGDTPPASWGKNLQGCISRLRKTLGPEAIHTTAQGYRLELPDDEVDIHRFGRLVSRGRELLELGQPERAAYTIDEALDLWRGEPLVELEDWEPGRIEAARLDELKLEAEELALDAKLQSGHHLEVLAASRALAEAAPLRERRWVLLARAQYQAGQQTEALRTINRVRANLVRELGLDPSPELAQLEQAILRQDPSLQVDEATAQAELCPYLGLKPYDVDDAEGFFGRDEVVVTCVERLKRHGFLAVVGPSGSGKSSVVRAGVASSLRRQGVRVVVMNPGRQPYDALTASGRQAQRSVLVVDQFEEVFSLCKDEGQREQFVAALVEHARRGRLVIAFRADRMGDLAAHPRLAELVESGLHLLSSMDEQHLRAAVDGPARQAGLVVEPGLVDLLVREVQGEPGALPLLSHVLRETWLRREGRTLTVAGYRDSGGIRKAVALSAETVFNSVDTDQQRSLRDLLLRLVTPGPEGAPIRTRMPRRQSDSAQDKLIDLLVASRLVISDDGVVELAHEALADAWPRLRAWLDDDVEGQRLLHHLADAADAWDSLGRPTSELYRGTRLARALEWRDRSHADLTKTEREFLDAGGALAAAEERSVAERARQQAVMIRRLRWTLTGAAVLLAAAVVAGGLAVHQSRVAQRNADAASSAALAAQARQLGTVAATTDDISLANLLAVRAVEMDDAPATRSDLMAVLAKHPQLTGASPPLGEEVARIALSPDGRRLAAYGADNDLFVQDTHTGSTVATLDLDGAGIERTPFFPLSPLAFSPEGDQLAVGSQTYQTPALRLLDPNTLRELPIRVGGIPARSKPTDVSFSATGRFLAASFMHEPRVDDKPGFDDPDASYTLVWDLNAVDAAPQRIDVPFVGLYEHMRLSPDGRTVYVGAPLTAYDVKTGKVIFKRPEIKTWLPLDLNRQGTRVASLANNSQDVMLVNARTGKVVHRLTGHTSDISDVVFAPSGDLVAAISGDRSVLVWDVRTGRVRYTVDDVQPSAGMAISPDERSLYSVAPEGMIRRWDLEGKSGYLRPLSMPSRAGGGFAFPSPDASAVVYPGLKDLVFARVGGEASGRVPTGWTEPYSSGSWSPNSDRFATGNAKGVVSVFDARGALQVKRPVTAGFVSSVDFTRDGSWLAVSDDRGNLSLLDAETLRPVRPALHLDGSLGFVTMSPDGTTAFVLRGDRRAGAGEAPTFREGAFVDVNTGRTLHDAPLKLDGFYADYSPDGREVAVVGRAGELLLLDAQGGHPRAPATIGHHSVAYWVTFSPDGGRVLTGQGDGTAGLWDAGSGALLDQVTIPGSGTAFPQFMSDSKSVLIATGGGPASVWDTRVERAIRFACRAAGRDFTADEWHQYVGSAAYEPTCPQT